MLQTHLRQGLRLNRMMGISLLAFSLILVGLYAFVSPVGAPWLSIGFRFGLSLVFTLVFFWVSHAALNALNRLNRPDDFTLEKLSLFLSLSSAVYLAAMYLVTGQVAVLLLLPIPTLQAQMAGHKGLAGVLAVFLGFLYLLSWFLGYPMLLGYPQAPLSESALLFGVGVINLGLGVQVLLSLLPLGWTLFYYGNVVARWMNTTSSRVTQLQSLAATDGLTGLINRRQFNIRLDSEIARAHRYVKPLSLALFDIDDFKKINDLYGHPTGDRILHELGLLVSANVRESDMPARYGGEEFALILPETGHLDACELLERLRGLIEKNVFCLPDNPMTVTVSVGVAQLGTLSMQAYELIEKTDTALYEAKKHGKNRVVSEVKN